MLSGNAALLSKIRAKKRMSKTAYAKKILELCDHIITSKNVKDAELKKAELRKLRPEGCFARFFNSDIIHLINQTLKAPLEFKTKKNIPLDEYTQIRTSYGIHWMDKQGFIYSENPQTLRKK